MCVAAPYRVIEVINSDIAIVDMNGNIQEVRIQMVPEVKTGDFVLTYLGSALAIVEEEEAKAAIRLYEQMNSMDIFGETPL